MRFIRVLFGFVLFFFFLGGVIKYYLDIWEVRELYVVVELRKSFYVDDLISGGVIVEKVRELK